MNNPQEKAKHLVRKFSSKLFWYNEKDNLNKSKECALIAVNEIIKSKELNYLFTKEQIYSMEGTSDDRWIHETFMKYWKKVKQEIEKL